MMEHLRSQWRTAADVVFNSVSDDPGRWDSHSAKWPERDLTGRTKRVGEITMHLADYGDDKQIFARIGDRVVGTAYFGYVGADLRAAVQVDPKYRRRGVATAMYVWVEEVAGAKLTPDTPHTPYAEALWNQPNRPFGRTSALSLEDVISVAEEAMERSGNAGRTIHVPVGHMDDPAYQAALAPLVDWVRSVTKTNVRFYASDYQLNQEGGAQAMTDGYNKIVVRPITTEMTVLHECAHVIRATDSGRGHDAAFAKVLYELYRTHIGPRAAEVFWGLVGPRVEGS